MTTKHNEPCPACDSLNYGRTCTCGELDDQPDEESPWHEPQRSRGTVMREKSSRAMEWQGMEGYQDPKE